MVRTHRGQYAIGVSIVEKTNKVGPVGATVVESRERRARANVAYREEQDRLAPYEQLARIVIGRRMHLGLTQAKLAERMGTSHSAISRIESGQHSTSVQTLRRLGQSLEMRFVMGFEYGTDDDRIQELVST